MFIAIDESGPALREPHDFKRLHIEANDMTPEAVAAALASIATRDGDNYWLDVAALKALGPAGDAAWERDFDAMIASVRKFGWLSPDGVRVRCHLKTK